ncbi:hypothetical protein lerEdw1_007647 [Lerista edwardsae]|nr:hypothetical protein lerEdw1_007647 [Lerista edwardsae]
MRRRGFAPARGGFARQRRLGLAARFPGMEALQGASLTPQEKEKRDPQAWGLAGSVLLLPSLDFVLSLAFAFQLKEQLAFLKREYRKTFHRLQRAERAERVKHPDKERAVEQSEPLLQKEAEKRPEDPLSQASPEASGPAPASAFLQLSPAKAAPAVLGREPEPATRGDSLPETSGSEWSTPEPDSARPRPAGPRPEKRRNRLSRSAARAQRRATPALGSCAALRENAGRQPEGGTASAGSSGSPTFQRRSGAVESDQNAPSTPPSTAGGGSRGVAVLEPQPGPRGQNACLGASSPPSSAGACENLLPSRHALEASLASSEAPAVEGPVERGAGRGEQAPVQAEEEQAWGGAEEPGRAAGLVGAGEAFRGSGVAPPAPGRGTPEAGSQREETQDVSLDRGETSLCQPGEMGLKGQGVAGPRRLEEALPEAPPESPLSSCTVVEGLPFPVEYYVRTTRQMSRCQRGVDLAAVLRGQLGRRRRGQRGPSLASPPLEPAGREGQPGAAPAPPPGARVGPACEAVPPPPQAFPGSPVPGQGLTQPRGGGRRPRGGAGCRAAPGASPELPPSKDCSSLGSREAHGWGAALPVGAGGSLEAPPAAPALESEGAWGSRTPTLGPGPALSRSGGLEARSEVPSPGRRAWEQEGPRSPAGAELVPPRAVPAPLCQPLDAARRSGGGGGAAPPGGEGSALSERSLGRPEPPDAKRETTVREDLPFHQRPQELRVPGAQQGRPGLDARAGEQLEALDSAQAAESLPCAGSARPEDAGAAGAPLGCASLEREPAGSPPLQQPLPPERAPSRELLLSPAPESTGSPVESQLPALVFPLVGATPASPPLTGGSPSQAEGGRPRPPAGAGRRPEEAAGAGSEASRGPAGQSAEPCEESPKQAASSSCSVDVSAVWWGAAGSAELCIAIACEAAVSLWRPLGADRWEALHTWHLAEVPVSQIVPLPDVHSLLCVALGGWEMAQIRFLFQPSEDGGPEQSQVKAGDIRAVLGLKNRRLVVGCRSLHNQTVEVVSFSEAGKNLRTGQLLRRIPVGQPGPAAVCHKAFSDAGLLFVVLSRPRAEESEAGGAAAFQVVVLNPKTARSTGVAVLPLPRDVAGRQVGALG